MSTMVKRVEGPMTLGDALARMVTYPGTMIQADPYTSQRFWLTKVGGLCMAPDVVCGCKFTYFLDIIRGNPNRWYIVEEVNGPTIDDVLNLAQTKGVTFSHSDMGNGKVQVCMSRGSTALASVVDGSFKGNEMAMKLLNSGVFDDN